MLIDLHAQTRATAAGGHDPARVIEAAQRAGLDGVAFVERQHTSHARELLSAGQAANFPVFVGVEIPATVGRFLCFAPDVDPFLSREEWRQLMAVGLVPTYERIFDLFDGMGGAVLASQPYARDQGMRLGDHLVYCDRLHGVEAVSGAGTRVECRLAIEAAVKMGLPLAGGSGVGRNLSDIGKHATLFANPIANQRDLVNALRDGNFWAVELGERGHVRPPAPRRHREEGEGNGGGGERRHRGERGGGPGGGGGGDDRGRRRRGRRRGPPRGEGGGGGGA